MTRFTNETMTALRAPGPMYPGAVGGAYYNAPVVGGFDLFQTIGNVLSTPLKLVGSVVKEIPIVGDIASPILDTVTGVVKMPWDLLGGAFGGGGGGQPTPVPPALPPTTAPYQPPPTAPYQPPSGAPSGAAAGILTARATPQPPAGAPVSQLKAYAQQILMQPIPSDMVQVAGITLPRFPFMDTLTAGRDFLLAIAGQCGFGPNPTGDPLVQRWLSLNGEFLRYAGQSQYGAQAQQMQQQLMSQLPVAASRCAQQQRRQAPALPALQRQQTPAPTPAPAQGQRACETNQYFRNKCIPPFALPCPTGRFNAKVDMQGTPILDKQTGYYKIWCMKGPRTEDIITQIAPGLLMRQPAITPYAGFPVGRRRRVIRAAY